MTSNFENYEPVPKEIKIGKKIRLLLIGFFLISTILVLLNASINFWLNVIEFGELFLRPIYFGFIGGIILVTISLFRLDFKNRRSIFWWFITVILKVMKNKNVEDQVLPVQLDFNSYKLSQIKFWLWQLTKIIFLLPFFMNVMFGMAVNATMLGWSSGISFIPKLMLLPFTTPTMDIAFAQEHVIPAIPALSLLFTPVMSAIGLRLFILIGMTHMIRVLSPSLVSYGFDKESKTFPIATFEGLFALLLIWTMINSLFPSFIDYNTKFVIAGLGASGLIFSYFAYTDNKSKKPLVTKPNKSLYIRLGSLFIIILIVGSAMTINNSIADAKKVEWLGPYKTQQISVNRYLAEINDIHVVPYNFTTTSSDGKLDYQEELNMNKDLLKRVRLWDWQAAFDKLKPEIGLIPYIDFADSDILRFNNTLYWSSSMKLILPNTVATSDQWFATHLYYTHVPSGFLILSGHEGNIVDPSNFFQERQIFYGESGLFKDVWATYPDIPNSDALGGESYQGDGGIKLSPPLSWLFEFNFFLSYPDTDVTVLRYRDVQQRVQLLFPYFEYELFGKSVDMYPVSDGDNTYWAMPLIIRLNQDNVPWSSNGEYMRFVGYALIDTIDGDIQIVILGDDFFSDLFKSVYSDYVLDEIPEWLKSQTKYPEELFEWRVAMLNYYYITDVATFISGEKFLNVPEGLDTYYVIAKPPGFEESEFLGLLSLELKDSKGANLAGYVVVRNDFDHLGETIFYKVALDAKTKLLGPSGVTEALERDPDFSQLRTLLRNPRLGDTILYRIGEHDVYVIPIYTSPGGGVVTQIGKVAVVGATFTGEYHVGLGDDAEDAFLSYLQKVQGGTVSDEKVSVSDEKVSVSDEKVSVSDEKVSVSVSEEDKKLIKDKIEMIADIIIEKDFTLRQPIKISPDISFLELKIDLTEEKDMSVLETQISDILDQWKNMYNEDTIIIVSNGNQLNVGILIEINGIVEFHYISINLH